MKDLTKLIKRKALSICPVCGKPIKMHDPRTVTTAYEHWILIHSDCAAGLREDSPPEAAERRGHVRLAGKNR